MEAAGGLAGNNHLTAVFGHLDLCLRHVRRKSALHQALMMIQRNIKSIGKMNNKLSVSGTLGVVQGAEIDLNQNLREIRAVLKRRLLDGVVPLQEL